MRILGDQAVVGPLGSLFQHHSQRWTAYHPNEILPSIEQSALDDLYELIGAHVTDPDSLNVYQHAIQELRGQFQVHGLSPPMSLDISDLFLWIFELIDDFFILLKVPTQEAVVIFAYFCVLLKKLEFHCWLEGWADHLMTRVQELVDEDHQAWISWPMTEIQQLSQGV